MKQIVAVPCHDILLKKKKQRMWQSKVRFSQSGKDMEIKRETERARKRVWKISIRYDINATKYVFHLNPQRMTGPFFLFLLLFFFFSSSFFPLFVWFFFPIFPIFFYLYYNVNLCSVSAQLELLTESHDGFCRPSQNPVWWDIFQNKA